MAQLNNFFDKAFEAIMLGNATEKCRATQALLDDLRSGKMVYQHAMEPLEISTPGFPDDLQLVAPRNLKRRGIARQAGRNALMHAIAHIEFNAINLALDAAYRFRGMPEAFYRDWINVAADEARHFKLICGYLDQHNCRYGDHPVHSGLWDMAFSTRSDVVARMALIPRVLEARGLDVTPAMVERLKRVSDDLAVEVLQVIYTDEIEHVKTGSKWFKYCCDQRGLEQEKTFIRMIDQYLHGELRGPFNKPARRLAGFNDDEMDFFTSLE